MQLAMRRDRSEEIELRAPLLFISLIQLEFLLMVLLRLFELSSQYPVGMLSYQLSDGLG